MAVEVEIKISLIWGGKFAKKNCWGSTPPAYYQNWLVLEIFWNL